MSEQPTIALVAGEASGDQLGAALVAALRQRYPGARFCGVGGAGMRAAGMQTWWDSEELALFGLVEVLAHLPRLLRLRRALRRRLLDLRPDVFIGIDAPDFNLGLESQLRRRGLRTVHYVSPTVWAWRPGRVRKIAQAADRVLCLFPFEPAFYDDYGVAATYVGHPLADQISPEADVTGPRRQLGLGGDDGVVAFLPGSRVSEVARLAPAMIRAARRLADRTPELRFIAAIANQRVGTVFQTALQQYDQGQAPAVQAFEGQVRAVIGAADVVLCASGTATLETMLVNRPMVVAYRLAPATYHLAKGLRLVKRQWFALPNILAGERLVPELIQAEVTPERLAREAQHWLTDTHAREVLHARFDALGRELRCDASRRAADAVAAVLGAAR
jgi:lipid-A-disaccharide synthase